MAHHGRYRGDRTAVTLMPDRRQFTYAELDRQIDDWAFELSRQGVVRGDRVCILASNRLEHLTLFFACTRLGAILVPLNFRLSEHELNQTLSGVKPRVSYTDWLDGRPDAVTWHTLDTPPRVDEKFPAVDVAMDDVLMLLFTSGSTGEPKGVMMHAGMLLWNAIQTQSEWGFESDDVTVIHTPFFHTGGYNVTALPLLRAGGRLVLMDRFEPRNMLTCLVSEKVSLFFAVPTMFQAMAECDAFDRTDLSRLKLCISGGAPLPKRVLDKYRGNGILLKQGFGLTEVGPNCFSMPDDQAAFRPLSVGRPIMHSRVELRDDQGNQVALSEVGELCIKGPHVCKGYWQKDELFAAQVQGGFFRTGDLMRCDDDGYFTVVGRIKEMYISGGENVYPAEVVAKILQHPDIKDAVVLAMPDERWGEVGCAFVRVDREIELNELRAFLNPLLSRYKHPHRLICMDAFPLLPNGKVDKAALQKELM
ncbi:MAG: AMP-binding protein [Acidobacteria bacterium]|nr:AMP-binding protein [Acidobacteriota bacterium]